MTKYLLFPIQRCLLQSLVQKWRYVVRTRLTLSRSVMASVAVSSLGRLILRWSRYKGERPVLSRCLTSSTASASHSRPVWWLLYFSTGQRSCRQGAWDRAAVTLWNTRLHRFSSVASQQSWPEPGRLPDVGKHHSRMHGIDQLKSYLIEEWKHFHHVFIDEVIGQWRPHLQACIQSHGGHFEHRL